MLRSFHINFGYSGDDNFLAFPGHFLSFPVPFVIFCVVRRWCVIPFPYRFLSFPRRSFHFHGISFRFQFSSSHSHSVSFNFQPLSFFRFPLLYSVFWYLPDGCRGFAQMLLESTLRSGLQWCIRREARRRRHSCRGRYVHATPRHATHPHGALLNNMQVQPTSMLRSSCWSYVCGLSGGAKLECTGIEQNR